MHYRMNCKTILCIGIFVMALTSVSAADPGFSIQGTTGLSIFAARIPGRDGAAQAGFDLTAAGIFDLNTFILFRAGFTAVSVWPSLPDDNLNMNTGFDGYGAGIGAGILPLYLRGSDGFSVGIGGWIEGQAYIMQQRYTQNYFLLPAVTVTPSMEIVPPGSRSSALKVILELPAVLYFGPDYEYMISCGLRTGVKLRLSRDTSVKPGIQTESVW